MPSNRFWVLGGKYTNMCFDKMIIGSEIVVGPFESREQAEQNWRRLSECHRADATMRFSILAETINE